MIERLRGVAVEWRHPVTRRTQRLPIPTSQFRDLANLLEPAAELAVRVAVSTSNPLHEWCRS